MRINSKNLPNNIRLLHAISHKRITKASEVNLEAENIKEFIDNLSYKMIKTCLVDGGIGLAAPQLGIPKKVIVVKEFVNQEIWDDYTDFFNVYINPKITQNNKSDLWEFNESCLSVPGASLPIKRHNEIIISYWSYNFIEERFKFIEDNIKGYLARVLLHEYDHLNGISILDRYRNQNK